MIKALPFLMLCGCNLHLHVHYHRGDPADPAVTIEHRIDGDPQSLAEAIREISLGATVEDIGRRAIEEANQ